MLFMDMSVVIFYMSVMVSLISTVCSFDPVLFGTSVLPPFKVFLVDHAERYEHYLSMQDTHQRVRMETWYVEQILRDLSLYIHATADEKGPPPLETAPQMQIDCSAERYAKLLTGERRATPAEIYYFVPISHELDLLEVSLFELNDTVDAYILVEGTHTHRGARKPLFYASHKERFAAFANKIVHLVADDGAWKSLTRQQLVDGSMHDGNRINREKLLNGFMNSLGGSLPSNEALIISGDLDEMPHRPTMLHIKHCHLRPNILPFGFSGPYYKFSYHWHKKPNEAILHLPTVCSVGQMRQWNHGSPSLCRDRSLPSPALASASHHNRFSGSLVDVLFKEIASAENGFLRHLHVFDQLRTGCHEHCLDGLAAIAEENRVSGMVRASQDVYVPWYADAHRERYPWFFFAPEDTIPEIHSTIATNITTQSDTYSELEIVCPTCRNMNAVFTLFAIVAVLQLSVMLFLLRCRKR